jgi:CYTH domain-containing protein
MATEIERRFLVDQPPSWLPRCPAKRIEQGYLVAAGDFEVRLRHTDDERVLTVKRRVGEVRDEIELSISAVQDEVMWPLTGSRRVTKTRRLVEVDEHCVEVDEFDGPLEGLVVAEVEFDSEAQSEDFVPPSWLGEEVTGDERYAGQALAELAAAGSPA